MNVDDWLFTMMVKWEWFHYITKTFNILIIHGMKTSTLAFYKEIQLWAWNLID
jgi:hypothetical protein